MKKGNTVPSGLIITGASRGIGAATARLAGSLGYKVCVNYINDGSSAAEVVADIFSAGGVAIAVKADISSEAEITHLFNTAETEFGELCGLVNNAGITGPIGSFVSSSTDNFRSIFDLNVHGSFMCAREAIRRFSKSGKGNIINLSSVAATTGAPGEYVHYAASKAAIDAFTLGLAREVAEFGIRVNAVAPGSTLTDIHATAGEPDRPARVKDRIPMRRLADPEEIAQAIVWLLSDAASYVTGTVLRVSGGF